MTDAEKMITESCRVRALEALENCKKVFAESKVRGDAKAYKESYRNGWFWKGYIEALEELVCLID